MKGKRHKKLEKHTIGVREFRFFYIIGWLAKYCITHWTSPTTLSRLNTGLPNGGKCTYSKSHVYNYLIKDNPTAKIYLTKSIYIPYNISWSNAKNLLRGLKGKKIVLKPDNGSRSMGVVITADDTKKKELLEARGKMNYIAQEHIPYTQEVGVFYYRYPTWKKGRILGIADRKFEEIVDPHNKEQYTDRPDLITPQVTEIFNKIIGDKEIYFCRFDIRAKSLKEFKKGRGFKILEVNAGPDAVALHAFDSRYTLKEQLRRSTEIYMHAFNISEINHRKPRTGPLRYLWFMIKDEIPLQLLRWRTRKITSYKGSS